MKPGFTDTALTWGIRSMLPASPEQCGRACMKAVQRKAATAYVPSWWWAIMLIIRLLPTGIMKRLKF
jgi:hypothetical protein